MLNICCSYASTHGLKFNPEKSQLIGFRLRHTHPCSSTIKIHDTTLPYSNEVTHLGHVLSYNLDDTPDIVNSSNLAWFCSLYASALSSSSDLVRIVYFDGCYRDFSSVHELDIVFLSDKSGLYMVYLLLDQLLNMLIIMCFVPPLGPVEQRAH